MAFMFFFMADPVQLRDQQYSLDERRTYQRLCGIRETLILNECGAAAADKCADRNP